MKKEQGCFAKIKAYLKAKFADSVNDEGIKEEEAATRPSIYAEHDPLLPMEHDPLLPMRHVPPLPTGYDPLLLMRHDPPLPTGYDPLLPMGQDPLLPMGYDPLYPDYMSRHERMMYSGDLYDPELDDYM